MNLQGPMQTRESSGGRWTGASKSGDAIFHVRRVEKTYSMGETRPLRARVRLVEPYGFTKISALGVEEQRVNVISDFLDRSAALGDGYRVETHIVIWTGQNVMKVPISAIFRHGQSWSVYVIAGKRAELREVDVGHRNEAEAEIQKGLSEEDRVIVHPPSELRAGMRVRFDE